MPEPEFSSSAWRLAAGYLTRVSRQLERVRQDNGPDAIHDLRVAARRLFYLIDCLHPAFDYREAARLRKRLKSVLQAAGAVRDRDIALDLAAEAGLEPQSPLVLALERQRERLAGDLRKELGRRRFSDFAARWSERLRRP